MNISESLQSPIINIGTRNTYTGAYMGATIAAAITIPAVILSLETISGNPDIARQVKPIIIAAGSGLIIAGALIGELATLKTIEYGLKPLK